MRRVSRFTSSALELLLCACFAGCGASSSASTPAPARAPAPAPVTQPRSAPIVIVPGTGAGVGTYERLVAALQARGRTAMTVPLAGMAERVAELKPELDENFHAQEVADFLVAHDLKDATLVGHSYGGFPMTGAVGRAPEGRIGCLIYLDAYVPKNGDSLFALDPKLGAIIQKRADEQGEGWRIPRLPAKQFLSTPEDIAWFEAHVTESPLAMFKTPLVVDDAALARVPKAYVAFEQYKFFQHAGEALARAGGKYRRVHAQHMGVYSAPEATADALLAVEP